MQRDKHIVTDDFTLSALNIRSTNTILRPSGVERTIHELFERTAKLDRARLATTVGKRAITYQELNSTANRVAHGLLETCGSRHEAVPLSLEHTSDTAAAILGTPKAGEDYIALDPAFRQVRWAKPMSTAKKGWR